MQFLIKTIISALIIATVSYIGKKSPIFGAIIVSLPLTSMIAIFWLYRDTNSTQNVIELSYSILWIIIPSLVFFISLVWLLKNNLNFYFAMGLSSLIMIIGYFIYVFILRKIGINI